MKDAKMSKPRPPPLTSISQSNASSNDLITNSNSLNSSMNNNILNTFNSLSLSTKTDQAVSAVAGQTTTTIITTTTTSQLVNNSSDLAQSAQNAKPDKEHLIQTIRANHDINAEQQQRLVKFLELRDKIGEIANDDLSVEGELGSGNGGVVLKVRHRKLDVDMAKKVL